MKERKTFELILADDLKRDLPVVKLRGTNQEVASFVMLGDVELNKKCAVHLVHRMKEKDLLKEFDYLVTVEAKGITLCHEIAALLEHPRFAVIRKSAKKYMQKPIMTPSDSITSGGDQTLVLDGLDIERIRGKRVCIVEDVISTGGSITAACDLLEAVGAEVTVIATVLLLEGGNFRDSRMIYLKEADV